MIVVDVNVIAYLLVQGPQTGAIEELRRSDDVWAVPLLWRSEWHSVLAGYLRRGEIELPEALACVEAAKTLVRGREHLVEGERVMHLVAASACSAYDCEYVALAETLDVPLVTHDREILAAFPGRARTPEAHLSG